MKSEAIAALEGSPEPLGCLGTVYKPSPVPASARGSNVAGFGGSQGDHLGDLSDAHFSSVAP